MKKHETRITVRFNEVDSYGVAWHGHYVAWMEVGRNDLAGCFGLDAAHISECGYLAPVVELSLQYKRPARFGEELRILTSARRTETATIEFVCSIVNADGAVCATGRTVHALTGMDGTLQYRLPPAIGERLERMLAWLEE